MRDEWIKGESEEKISKTEREKLYLERQKRIMKWCPRMS